MSRLASPRWYWGVPLVFVTVTAFVAAPPRPAEPTCVVAARWVQAHRDQLPTKLEAFSHYSVSYRKAIYHELAIPQRRELWREHLNSFVGHGSALSAAQQLIVARVLANLDRYIDKPANARAALEEDGLDTPYIKAQLGDSLARVVFATLGPEEVTASPTPPTSAADSTAFGMTASPPPDCVCSLGHDWCSHGECLESSCKVITSDCGFLLIYDCDGACGTIIH